MHIEFRMQNLLTRNNVTPQTDWLFGSYFSCYKGNARHDG